MLCTYQAAILGYSKIYCFGIVLGSTFKKNKLLVFLFYFKKGEIKGFKNMLGRNVSKRLNTTDLHSKFFKSLYKRNQMLIRRNLTTKPYELTRRKSK